MTDTRHEADPAIVTGRLSRLWRTLERCETRRDPDEVERIRRAAAREVDLVVSERIERHGLGALGAIMDELPFTGWR